MDIRKLLKKDFDIDLPIKGGAGNLIDNPVIIERTRLNDYVAVEHMVLKYLGLGRNIDWKIISQELIQNNDREIDKIKIETISTTEEEIITQIENYYFDITECVNVPLNKDFESDVSLKNNIKTTKGSLEYLRNLDRKSVV